MKLGQLASIFYKRKEKIKDHEQMLLGGATGWTARS